MVPRKQLKRQRPVEPAADKRQDNKAQKPDSESLKSPAEDIASLSSRLSREDHAAMLANVHSGEQRARPKARY